MAKISKEEYEILKSLDDEWKWIARDREAHITDIHMYSDELRKSSVGNQWIRSNHIGSIKQIDSELFQFIQWEDEEPYRIQELIDEYESEYHIESAKIVNIDANKITGSVHQFNESEETEVKKDLNWFKEKLEVLKDIDRRMLEQSEPNSKNQSYFNGSMAAIDEALDFLNQLDEPKVLSWEWIDENKKDSGVHYIGYYVPIGRLHDLLVPKQEEVKVKSQDFDLIKTHKVRGENLHDFVHSLEVNRENCDRLVEAWLAYPNIEVEEEQKYYVLDTEDIPMLVRTYGDVNRANTHLGIHEKGRNTEHYQLTEQEIKDYDERYIPFMVPVDEVNND